MRYMFRTMRPYAKTWPGGYGDYNWRIGPGQPLPTSIKRHNKKAARRANAAAIEEQLQAEDDAHLDCECCCCRGCCSEPAEEEAIYQEYLEMMAKREEGSDYFDDDWYDYDDDFDRFPASMTADPMESADAAFDYIERHGGMDDVNVDREYLDGCPDFDAELDEEDEEPRVDLNRVPFSLGDWLRRKR